MNHKFITLEELMKQVRAELLTQLSWSMGIIIGYGEPRAEEQPRAALDAKGALKTWGRIEELCHECGLEFSAISARRLVNLLKGSDMLIGSQLKEFFGAATELQGRVHDEMKRITYFFIEPSKKYLIEGGNLFGSEVAEAFPSTPFNIEEAGKCLAFERWTAAVYHLSRVAETATVTICKRVGYVPSKQGTGESFGEALKYMDSNLDKARKDYEHANPLFKGDIEFLATVTAQMHAVNDAWRKKVSHMDRKYTGEEAMRIWDTTKVLMQQLATKLKEETDA